MVGLDLTVLNVALPTLATELHASTGQLQWIADAYNLVLAATLLPAGLLGDRFGRKRVLLGALVVFGAASVACAYAGTAGELIAARAALGLGAAALLPLSVSVLPVLFTPEERPRAIAVWATANSIGIPLGPILGGWLLDRYWWGSVFLITVPLIAVALAAVAVLLPESRDPGRPRLDLVGVAASSIGLVGITYGAIEAGEKGWSDPVTLVALAVGALALVAFVRRQRRTADPLVDLSLFRSPSFTWGAILATMVSFALFGLLFTMPQFFQAVGGADALGTGLRLLPVIGGLIVGVQVAERIASRAGARTTIALGFALLALGLGAGATSGVGSGYGFAATWMGVVGLGLGFALPKAMDTALGALSPARAGVGSALLMALRQVGGTIGVAVLGTVLSSGYRGQLDLAGLPAQAADVVRRSAAAGVAVASQLGSPALLAEVRAAFVHGMDSLLWVSAGLAAIGIVLALAFVPRRSEAAAPPDADRAQSAHEPVASA